MSNFSLSNDDPSLQTHQTVYDCSPTYDLLINSDGSCNARITLHQNVLSKSRKALKRKLENLAKPAKLNAPISLTSPERIKLTPQQQRSEIVSLKLDLKKLKNLQ